MSCILFKKYSFFLGWLTNSYECKKIKREKHTEEILDIEIISESYKQLDTSTFKREKEMGNILEKHRETEYTGTMTTSRLPRCCSGKESACQ